MLVLFCADPLDPRAPDSAWADEVAAARAAGAEIAVIEYEALVDGRGAEAAIRHVPPREAPALAIYRGWMLRAEACAELFAALATRGVTLINSAVAYRHTHHLPESYEAIAPHTPRSIWLPSGRDTSLDALMEALRPLGDGPVIVKDYVKSRKHEWEEACFIPSAADRATVERVVRCFLERQGEDLVGGLVFREFVRFRMVGTHSRSGMPLAREFRRFILGGQPLLTAPYWPEVAGTGDPPPDHLFGDVLARVESRFFTADLAEREDGGWMIMELGDAQVAGLPDGADPTAFYQILHTRWPAV
jgi:hypothetical protein